MIDIPEQLILMTLGAFLLGWILAAINSRMNDKYRARKRDHRDDRIRSLEADLRVAESNLQEARTRVEELEDQIEDATSGIEKRDTVITHQQSKIEKAQRDLKDSVLKTRELRAELSERAEESVRSEVKQRELETELSVAQASTDMIATGVLDYSLAPDGPDSEDAKDDSAAEQEPDKSDLSKAGT